MYNAVSSNGAGEFRDTVLNCTVDPPHEGVHRGRLTAIKERSVSAVRSIIAWDTETEKSVGERRGLRSTVGGNGIVELRAWHDSSPEKLRG